MLNTTNHQGKATQNFNEILPHSHQDGDYRKAEQCVLTSMQRNWKLWPLLRECEIVQPLWKMVVILQNLKIESPYDSATPLLAIYPRELKAGSQRGSCIPSFIAALLTIAKTWKQPQCPRTDKRLSKNAAHTYNGVLFRHAKEGNPAKCCSMDDS